MLKPFLLFSAVALFADRSHFDSHFRVRGRAPGNAFHQSRQADLRWNGSGEEALRHRLCLVPWRQTATANPIWPAA